MVLLRVVSLALIDQGLRPVASVYDTREGVKLYQHQSRTDITVLIRMYDATARHDLSMRVWSILENLGYILHGQSGNREFVITGRGKAKPLP